MLGLVFSPVVAVAAAAAAAVVKMAVAATVKKQNETKTSHALHGLVCRFTDSSLVH